ncbi:hypothetical protein [Botrimarina hoheduenensis]|uniref:Uncharacterized protein n=1 Tax=Botrimarina hoheduenensis TaxID=2528000 RepID=A0A5C5WFR3_9BACT|nr:hypothetical protein [Botrimarina hoheduenensis]TWT48929.1 hypothetical protein Pla111_07070 [Botrimarina hoheduenensis]
MFLLFLRYVPAAAFWIAKHAGAISYRNCNLQTLILAPLIVVLLLLPAVFSGGRREPRSSQSTFATTVGHTAAGYEAPTPWGFER